MNNRSKHFTLSILLLSVLFLIFPICTSAKGLSKDDPFTTKEEAADYLKQELTKQTSYVTFYYQDYEIAQDLKTNTTKVSSFMHSIYEIACNNNPSKPNEGDYLAFDTRWKPTSSTRTITDDVFCVKYQVIYNTPQGKDSDIQTEIGRILAGLSLNGLTDREKIEKIYRYVAQNVSFKEPTEWKDYTAYAALFEHKATCQGYSSLLYRMLLTVGIDCRIIANIDPIYISAEGGIPDSQFHSWNIVKCDGQWYSLDATWDRYESTQGNLQWFMLCSDAKDQDTLPSHIRHSRYSSKSFFDAYPMAVHQYTTIVTGANSYQVKCSVCGHISKEFTVPAASVSTPKGTVITKVTALSKGFKVIWKKQMVNTNGYQIQYSLKSNFKNAKTITITKSSILSKKVTKLKKKKVYYLRIRTYKTVSGNNYYSSWSAKKKVKTK